jgi:hypothetical protein
MASMEQAKMRTDNDVVASAMSVAWDRVRLPERQAAMAAKEHEAFAILATQLRVPLAELTRRAEQRMRHR